VLPGAGGGARRWHQGAGGGRRRAARVRRRLGGAAAGLPPPQRLRLALGDRVLLYTDGASEARARGGFFPLQAAAAFALVSDDLEAGLESLWAELQRHVAGQLHDDVALLLIEHSR
jgi:Stage II sporulation protein E (SpoIIE)